MAKAHHRMLKVKGGHKGNIHAKHKNHGHVTGQHTVMADHKEAKHHRQTGRRKLDSPHGMTLKSAHFA